MDFYSPQELHNASFLMEYELFRPAIIHMAAAWNFSYGFVKRCFITSIIYFEQLQK